MTEIKDCHIREVRTISGQIEVVTGLRIGANVEQMEISGLDNPILRCLASTDPHIPGEPYIPGSSLKGKMRSLAEWYFKELPEPSGELVLHMKKEGRVARVFGVPADKKPADSPDRKAPLGPTRTLVRDAFLSDKDRKRFLAGEPITEVKTENSINRLIAMANPRPMERVLPGVRFDFQIVYRIFDTGDGGRADAANFEKVLLPAMALLEQDYLGSCGSRGCGQIRFVAHDPRDDKDKPGILVDGNLRELRPVPFPPPEAAG